MKSIHNPELFKQRDGSYIVQWLERGDGAQWVRRRGHVRESVGMKLYRMDPYQLLEWIAKRIKEPVEPEMPPLDVSDDPMTRRKYS